MTSILHFGEYLAVRVIFGVLGTLPLNIALVFAAKCTRFLLSRGLRHRRALSCLAFAYPEKSKTERRRIASQMWESVGRATAEAAHADLIAAEPDRFEVLDPHRVFRDYRDKPHPIVCISLHTGNWELLPLPMTMAGRTPAAAYRTIENPLVDKYVRKQRQCVNTGGLFPVRMENRQSREAVHSLRNLAHYVRNDGILGLLSDYRDFQGLPVNFFGQTVMWPLGPANLAQRLGVPVCLARSIRIGEGSRFITEFRRVPSPGNTGKIKDAHKLTAAIVAQFEAWIREFPEQWMWMRAPFVVPGEYREARPTGRTRLQGGMTGGVRWDDIALLGQCLSLTHQPSGLFELRVRLFSDAQAWRQLTAAALSLGLIPTLADRLAENGLLPPEPRDPSITITPGRVIGEYAAFYAEHRSEQTAALVNVVRAYNDRGTTPILLGGAASMWRGEAPCRHRPAMDIVAGTVSAATSRDILAGVGYREMGADRARDRLGARTFLNPSVPGWLVIRRTAVDRAARRWLEDERLSADGISSVLKGAEALVPPAHLAAVLAVAEIHYGDPAGLRAPIPLDALFEFAITMQQMPESEAGRLHALSKSKTHLAAVLDYWIAAAADLLGLEPNEPFVVRPDAVERWRRTKALYRANRKPSRFQLLGADLRMAAGRALCGRAKHQF